MTTTYPEAFAPSRPDGTDIPNQENQHAKEPREDARQAVPDDASVPSGAAAVKLTPACPADVATVSAGPGELERADLARDAGDAAPCAQAGSTPLCASNADAGISIADNDVTTAGQPDSRAIILLAASPGAAGPPNPDRDDLVHARPATGFEPGIAGDKGATAADAGNSAAFAAGSGELAPGDNLAAEHQPGNGVRTDAIVPCKYGAGDVLTAGVQAARKGSMLVTVSVSALVAALDSITLPVADLPDPKSVRTTPGAPCFTMIITNDQMRFHLTRHGTTVETLVPVVERTGGDHEEKAFILPDTALFELFPMAKIRGLERDARPAGPLTEPVVVFEIDPHGPTMAATFGAARIQVRVLPGKAPAAITRFDQAAILLDCSVPHALARALGLASTFKLTESRSARQESSPLNVISCANGSVRGGSGEAFTVVTSSCLAPFGFSVHRRDVRVLAHLLRRAGKWTYRAEGSKIQFADGNRVIEVQQPAKDFADIAAMSDKFRTESGGYPVQAMAVMTAGSIQSAAQVSHDPKHPVMTTVAFSDGHDGDIVLRSRSANGWNEALARVAVLGPASSGPTVYTTVALRNLFAAVCTARADSKIALHATGNALLVVVTDDERVVTHILPSSVKPPLTACRCEQDQRQDQDREVLA